MALILGIVGGLWLASRAMSSGGVPPPTTVAGALALDTDGSDLDARRSEAFAVLVAHCMQANGLEWEPWVEPSPSVPDAHLAPIAWAERWGFGVSTTVGRSQSPPPDDPNLARIATSSGDLQTRYRVTLYGTSDGDPGCQRAANDAVYGLRERVLAPLRAALTDLDVRIAKDKGAIGAVDGWRSCVAPIAADGHPDRRTLTQRLIERFSAQVERLGQTPRSMAGLLAVQADERRVASTLARCEGAFADARSVVAAPFEAAFVAEHREELIQTGAAIRHAEAALPTIPP